MISNMKARINRAMVQGLSVNQFAAKMQATKGALRSLIFKMWFKLAKDFKRHTMALLPANKQGCFVLHHTDVKRELMHSLIAEADVYLLSTFETIADEYNAKIVIMGA
jgi:hypothetical protein